MGGISYFEDILWPINCSPVCEQNLKINISYILTFARGMLGAFMIQAIFSFLHVFNVIWLVLEFSPMFFRYEDIKSAIKLETK